MPLELLRKPVHLSWVKLDGLVINVPPKGEKVAGDPGEYKPKTRVYRSIWRNHRQHHFKNEHFWFTVTSSGTADRVLGTYPDATVETSPTAKNLHAIEG